MKPTQTFLIQPRPFSLPLVKISLILCGLSGCGKSFFGKKVAAELKVLFFDTDEKVEDIHGKKLSCREIYAQEGKDAFRLLEKEAVQSIPRDKPLVVATGGGTLLCDGNVTILQEIGTLIYLKTDPQTLLERLSNKKNLNYLNAENVESAYQEIIATRCPLYEKYASHQIDTSSQSSEEIIRTICTIASL